nr:hypothetical protein [Spirochaetales bacterium]
NSLLFKQFPNEKFAGSVPDLMRESTDASFSTLNNWTLSDDAIPRIQSDNVYEGSNAVQFGSIDSYGDDSSFEVIVNVKKASVISFYALKNNNIGTLRFDVDGYSKLSTSSTISPWTKYSYSLSAGVHTLKWYYYKYSSTAENVYIDDITISP